MRIHSGAKQKKNRAGRKAQASTCWTIQKHLEVPCEVPFLTEDSCPDARASRAHGLRDLRCVNIRTTPCRIIAYKERPRYDRYDLM